MMRNPINCLLFVLFLPFLGFSQDLEIGASVGQSIYFGDLDSPVFVDNLQHRQLAGGLFARYNFSPRFSVRLNGIVGALEGDDRSSDGIPSYQFERNLNFHSKIFELAGLIEFNLFNINPDTGNKSWTPYVTAGVAYLHYNPTTVFQGVKYELHRYGTEGQGIDPGLIEGQTPISLPEPYNLDILTLPLGGGLKFRVSDKVTLQAELAGRFTFTDYLDDVSGNYVSREDLLVAGRELVATNLANPSGLPRSTGDQRGGPSVKDYYFTGLFSASIRFGELGIGMAKGELGCPTF